MPLLEERLEKTDNTEPSTIAQNDRSQYSIPKGQFHRKRKSKAAKEDILKDKLSTHINMKLTDKKKTSLFANDEDRLFFVSLVGDFNKISDQCKFHAKTELLQVIKHYKEMSTQYPCESQNCYDNYFTGSSSNPDPHFVNSSKTESFADSLRAVLEDEIFSTVSTSLR